MMLAPFANTEWEIWACSPGTLSAPRADRRYEVHRWEPGQEWFSEGYVKALKEFKGPVKMFQQVPEIPNCEIIDWRAKVLKYSPYFFTSTLAWMMADALDEGFKRIALYGVDMGSTTEYHDQRMALHYFGMIAAQMGVEVGTPPESDLFRPAPLYGLCEQTHVWIKETARARELAARKRESDIKLEQAKQESQFYAGALDDQDWHLHSIVGAYDSINTETTGPLLPDIMKRDIIPAKPKKGR
jgi:hypothetical protein